MKTPLFKVFMPDTVVPALEQTLHSGFIAEGAKVREFGEGIGNWLGYPHVIPMSSCTMALTVAMRLSGVGPGTEVISTPLSCIATNSPIIQMGGKIVWADVEVETGMLDPASIEAAITERTRAVIVLHKEGDPCRLDEILAICKRHNIKLIEDAAHAFGSRYNGVPIGLHGDYVCYSFQAIKHLTTGDGGALVVRDPEDLHRGRELKWFGIERETRTGKNAWENDIFIDGYKGNMNDIAATIGVEQLKHFDWIIGEFHQNGKWYETALNDIPGLHQIPRREEDYSTYWAYCVRVERRKDLIRKCEEAGIDARQIHPRNDTLSVFREYARDLPGVAQFDAQELCFPCGWWVTPEERQRIADVIRSGW